MAIPNYGSNSHGDNLDQFAKALSGSKAWDAGSIADGDEEACVHNFTVQSALQLRNTLGSQGELLTLYTGPVCPV